MSFLRASVYDCTLRRSERYCLAAWRSELLEALSGDVLELGAGTGANLMHYPQSVRSLTLVEPDHFMRRKLARRLERCRWALRADVRECSAEALDLDDECVDAVVGTLVLCSVPDVARVLSEARRVLRPRGVLASIEHVAAPDGTVRHRWQSWLEPTWTLVSGGCRLLRDPRPAAKAAGFEPVRVTERELLGVPAFIRPAIVATWRK